MAERRGFLIDVYDTMVTCDFREHRLELPELAGVTQDEWVEGLTQFGPALTVGRISLAEAIGRLLESGGGPPSPDVVQQVVRRDQELLLAAAHLYDDVLPFLKALRSRGLAAAVVSNCSEGTRRLLDELGITDLVDALVLSCEVGSAKPAPEIFRHALDQLGLAPADAVFVDDQPTYCEGARDLGITAVQILRPEVWAADGAPAILPPETGVMTVSSLRELEDQL